MFFPGCIINASPEFSVTSVLHTRTNILYYTTESRATLY